MLGIKRILKVKPSEVTFQRVIEALKVRMRYPFQLVGWYSPGGFNKKNREKLAALNNIHNDRDRCFIIASGPSLKHIDFNLLRNEVTFAMNRAYLLEEQIGFLPTYLVCIDVYSQLLQFTNEYNQFDKIPTFFNWDLRHLFTKKENRYFIKTKFSPEFLTRLPGLFGNGKSVTYACIQLAFQMGFKEVYIIGKDHSYNTTSKVGDSVISKGNDGNHFVKGYYKQGQVYISPDYNGEEFAYQVAKDIFEKNNRIIKDATIDGKLQIFEKVDFYSLFNSNPI